jgi:hypothetical protein
MWILGAIGTIRLYNVVNTFDYVVLANMCFSGGSILFGVFHFFGNIPKACLNVLRSLKTPFTSTFIVPKQRRIITVTLRSLRAFGIKSGPIRLIKHNAIYLYFGALINVVVTVLVGNPEMGQLQN